MTGHEVDTRRIHDAFERELASYHAPPGLAGRARMGGLRRARRRRVHQAVSAAAAGAAVVTGLAVTPLAGTGPSGGGEGSLPSAASLGRAMLTAYHAPSGVIGEERFIYARRGTVLSESQVLTWPAIPVPGKQVRIRFAVYQRIPDTAKRLTLLEDAGAVFKLPRGTRAAHILATQVCYPFRQNINGCLSDFSGLLTRRGTWTRARTAYRIGAPTDLSPGRELNPDVISHGLISGKWGVVRRGRLDGQPAIEVGPIFPPAHRVRLGAVKVRGVWVNVLPVWVNARTHLPIRLGSRVPAGAGIATWQEFTYLPVTPASLALLQVRIPPGLPRSRPVTGA